MANESTCFKCGKPLESDAIPIYKKMINRGAEEFFCIDCSSRYLNVSVDLLRQKIVEFKKMGCTLFEA